MRRKKQGYNAIVEQALALVNQYKYVVDAFSISLFTHEDDNKLLLSIQVRLGKNDDYKHFLFCTFYTIKQHKQMLRSIRAYIKAYELSKRNKAHD